jgi:hypothetical protein
MELFASSHTETNSVRESARRVKPARMKASNRMGLESISISFFSDLFGPTLSDGLMEQKEMDEGLFCVSLTIL